MKRFRFLIAAVLSGLLLWAAWPTSPLTILIFIAWVPLLWLEDRLHNWKLLFGFTYITMFLWNICTTWWIWNASLPGALGAFFANSLIMCIPWLLFYFTKAKFGNPAGYASLILYWLAFEYLHHNWELTWPWLTLGNAFAIHPEWVQWYQVTGSSGGSLWILCVNILVYLLYREYTARGRTRKYIIRMSLTGAALIIPILISYFITLKEKKIIQEDMNNATRNVVVVQPNIDPYTEKFTGEIDAQIQKLIILSEQQIDNNTTLVIWPETAVPAQVWEDQIKNDYHYYPIWSFLHRHPSINLITGIDSYKQYGANKNDASKTARLDPGSGIYYDAFNTAAFFDVDTNIVLYHKAKLVPGVETLPSFLNFMSKWFESFGGISGTLGRDSERKVFVPWDNYYKAAPIICYESIFGDYITEYVRKGANLLTIITNDGWWGNTPGYKQHMNYARLRAIETRKWIARSANTGISCFIDPSGKVINALPWDQAGSIKLNIPVNNRQTFFVKYGDLLSKIATVIAVILIIINIGFWLKKRLIRS